MKKENENINRPHRAKDVYGEPSPRECDDWRKESAPNSDIEMQAKELWDETLYAQELSTIDVDAAWTNVKGRFSRPKEKMIMPPVRRYLTVAAVSAVLFASAFFLRSYLSRPELTSIHTADAIESVLLPDGTQVDLNVGSALTYPNEFAEDRRTVHLIGEAFFDVVHNGAKPFIIETEQLNVTVRGTSFNVKAYPDTENSEVTVSSGKVEVGEKSNADHVVLEAGDAAVYNKTVNSLKKNKAHTTNYIAWKTKEIEFNNTRLSDVFKTIEEVYHVSIVTDSKVNVNDDVLNATFSHHSLKHVLESVCASFNLKYQQVDGIYSISTRF